jgi:hypothetical protein
MKRSMMRKKEASAFCQLDPNYRKARITLPAVFLPVQQVMPKDYACLQRNNACSKKGARTSMSTTRSLSIALLFLANHNPS